MGRSGLLKLNRAVTMTVAAVGLVMPTSPAVAQHATGHSGAGQMTASHGSAGQSFNRPAGAPTRGGQRFGAVRPNSFGTSSAPPPSWELPKYVTPHWEIGPNVRVQPNPVQGNRLPNHHRNRFGVGYVGIPYYVDPFAFGNAWDWNDESDSGPQQAPGTPARSEYAPPSGYAEGPAEGPYDEGYPPPPPPGYSQEGFPLPAQSNAAQNNAEQTDGLDHPPVTLVFNDGRPAEKVQSYVLTGSSVFVADHGHQRKIPLADLNLPATVEQNREAGVDFELPGGTK